LRLVLEGLATVGPCQTIRNSASQARIRAEVLSGTLESGVYIDGGRSEEAADTRVEA
jgi:hypothetical protein